MSKSKCVGVRSFNVETLKSHTSNFMKAQNSFAQNSSTYKSDISLYLLVEM